MSRLKCSDHDRRVWVGDAATITHRNDNSKCSGDTVEINGRVFTPFQVISRDHQRVTLRTFDME